MKKFLYARRLKSFYQWLSKDCGTLEEVTKKIEAQGGPLKVDWTYACRNVQGAYALRAELFYRLAKLEEVAP